MDLSVIIVSYKGWERLTRCLEALDSFSGKRFSMEVIVVDNHSMDEAINRIEERFRKFRFLHNRINGGFANGCNLGAGNSVGDFLLFLNPDTVASEAEIEKLLNAARSNPAHYILSCRQVRENGKESKATGSFPALWNLTGFLKLIFFRKNSNDSCSDRIKFPDWVSGSVMMIRKEIFNRLKGFDEDFWMYSEDVDLCRRAKNMGGEIVYYGDIVVEHNHGGSSRIGLNTTSVAKCEVQISRHIYIQKHKAGLERSFIQTFMVINNLLTGIITGLVGAILFFIPELLVRLMVFLRLISYYTGSLIRHSWISPRSVNFKRRN
ncbi:MAG: glycosyltransferase family 2 protein [Bacteroidales bacterium]|nr:glycosyltransferase family 2 protein [Bacteroidales bacterium]